MEISDITIETWNQAEDQLRKIGRFQAATYTVVLVNGSQPFGTCVLLQHGGKKYFLTAAHVALKIGKKGYEKIGVAVLPDEFPRNLDLHPSCAFQPKFWDSNFKAIDLHENPRAKDLAIIEIPLFLESIINVTKGFIRLSEESVEELDFNACYIGFGIIKNDEKIQMVSLGLCLYEKQERDERDYYIARAMKETFGSKILNKPTILNFQGYSGGGLFLVREKSIRLVGIAYYQDSNPRVLDKGYVEIHFHGPK